MGTKRTRRKQITLILSMVGSSGALILSRRMEVPQKLSFGINVLLDQRDRANFNSPNSSSDDEPIKSYYQDKRQLNASEPRDSLINQLWRSEYSAPIRGMSEANSSDAETYNSEVVPTISERNICQIISPTSLISAKTCLPIMASPSYISQPSISALESAGTDFRSIISAALNGIHKTYSTGCTLAEKRIGHPYQSRLPARHKKPRTSFTKAQVAYLETRFVDQKYLASTERAKLAAQLDMSDSQVKTWFQNRRTKWRRQDAEERECEGRAAAKLLSLASNYIAINSNNHDVSNTRHEHCRNL